VWSLRGLDLSRQVGARRLALPTSSPGYVSATQQFQFFAQRGPVLSVGSALRFLFPLRHGHGKPRGMNPQGIKRVRELNHASRRLAPPRKKESQKAMKAATYPKYVEDRVAVANL